METLKVRSVSTRVVNPQDPTSVVRYRFGDGTTVTESLNVFIQRPGHKILSDPNDPRRKAIETFWLEQYESDYLDYLPGDDYDPDNYDPRDEPWPAH